MVHLSPPVSDSLHYSEFTIKHTEFIIVTSQLPRQDKTTLNLFFSSSPHRGSTWFVLTHSTAPATSTVWLLSAPYLLSTNGSVPEHTVTDNNLLISNFSNTLQKIHLFIDCFLLFPNIPELKLTEMWVFVCLHLWLILNIYQGS